MINKIKNIQIKYSDGLSCPICSSRILPGDIDEHPEDEELWENYTKPNYCEHVSYAFFDEDSVSFLSENVKAQLVNKGLFIEGEEQQYISILDDKGNYQYFHEVIDLDNIVEYTMLKTTVGDVDSAVGFQYSE